jgi:phosphate starvation-inducible PhoH-like protein
VTATDDVVHRLEVEGADPLALAGVNDANLHELTRLLGVRVMMRGDQLSLAGPLDVVERATPVVQSMIEIARMGEPMSAEDVRRLVGDAQRGRLEEGRNGEQKIILPGLRRVVAPKTAGQRAYLHAMYESEIVVGIGPAGTGKTYMAVAVAVDMLQKKRVKRIILARPAVEAGERLGFLPGDLVEKVHPYLRPLYDALYDMLEPDKVTSLTEKGAIEIAPLAYMRGRTLNDAFIILDEAQNTTSEQMKMFLTRLGFNAKMVITGDITQVDLPLNRQSGLIEIQTVLQGIDGIRFLYFDDRDVVRHDLVSAIVRAYDRVDSRGAARRVIRPQEPSGTAPPEPSQA